MHLDIILLVVLAALAVWTEVDKLRFYLLPWDGVSGLNDIKKLRCRSALVEATRLPSWAITSSGGRTPHHQPRLRATKSVSRADSANCPLPRPSGRRNP